MYVPKLVGEGGGGGPSKDVRLFLLTKMGLSKKLGDDSKCLFLYFSSIRF